MSISTSAGTMSLLTALVLLAGCAAKPISESARDTSGAYDGEWTVLGQKSPAIQYINNWQVSCNPNPFEFTLRVAQGKAYFGGVAGSGTQETNVGKDGKFTFIVPLETKTKESARSGAAITNGNSRVQFIGNLSENSLKGSFTFGVQQFAWQGCRSKLLFEKTS